MTKYLILISVIISGLIIAGAIIFVQKPQSAGPAEKKEEIKEFSITEKDHIRGDFSAPVTILEYSDFQCPFCATFHPTVQQILADFPDKVRWVYKHFPLDQIHPQARLAAEASECAAEQEKFWEFSDLLFENQERLGKEFYREIAESLGLNIEQFDNCVSSGKYKNKVETDYQDGIRAGVRGTPASFVNGEMVSGAVPYETLKTAIERALGNL